MAKDGGALGYRRGSVVAPPPSPATLCASQLAQQTERADFFEESARQLAERAEKAERDAQEQRELARGALPCAGPWTRVPILPPAWSSALLPPARLRVIHSRRIDGRPAGRSPEAAEC